VHKIKVVQFATFIVHNDCLNIIVYEDPELFVQYYLLASLAGCSAGGEKNASLQLFKRVEVRVILAVFSLTSVILRYLKNRAGYCGLLISGIMVHSYQLIINRT